MANGHLNTMIGHIRKLAGGDDSSDHVLLERFISYHDPAVFETLVQRHGPLIFGVCRRLLHHEQDAEDVFQATFLVLARRMESIRRHTSLGSWLYGVAYRLALKVKAGAALRRAHERQVANMPRTEPGDESAWRELAAVLDQELHQLPEKYRAPLILCYLEGKTHAEAANVLGWAQGSMARRLRQALNQLRARLRPHGIALPACLLSTLLAERALAAPPPALVQVCSQAAVLAATGQSLTSLVSIHAATLAEGVLQNMLSTKLKTGLAIVLGMATIAIATVLAAPGHRNTHEATLEEQQPRAVAPAEDLALIPGNAIGFARFAVHDIWTSKAMQQVRTQQGKPGLELLENAEKGLGVGIDNIEAVTLILLPEGGDPPLVAIFTTIRPYAQDSIREALLANERDQEKRYKDKSYYSKAGGDNAVYFAGERIFTVSTEKALRSYFDMSAVSGKPAALAGAFKLAEQKHEVVAGFQAERITQELSRQPLPPMVAFLRPLLALQSGTLTIDIKNEARARARLEFTSRETADEGKDAMEAGVGVLKQLLAAMPEEARKDPFAAMLLKEAGDALRTVQMTRQQAAVQVTLHTRAVAPLAAFLPGIRKTREAANRQVSANNMKQIALAMHNYAAANGNRFPPAAIRSKDGKPLLSWRVAILPYIDQDHLYRQFRLDEPWDSEHNKKLLMVLPRPYVPHNVEPQPGMTFIQVFTGKDTPFEKPDGQALAGITDGCSNTLLFVEASKAVPWTKPEDLAYDASKPLPKLGAEYPNVFMAALCDGSVRMISSTVAEKLLRALITANGGEIVENLDQ